jgi:hypothetical protein
MTERDLVSLGFTVREGSELHAPVGTRIVLAPVRDFVQLRIASQRRGRDLPHQQARA